MTIVNLVTPKARAKQKLLFNEPASAEIENTLRLNVAVNLWGLVVPESLFSFHEPKVLPWVYSTQDISKKTLVDSNKIYFYWTSFRKHLQLQFEIYKDIVIKNIFEKLNLISVVK